MGRLRRLHSFFFPDRRSYVLWPLAVAWMIAIGGYGWHFVQMGHPRAWIFGGILMLFSPILVALLLTRDRPDADREEAIARRRKERLADRVRGGRR